MPTSRLRHPARIAAVMALASLTLTGCADSVREAPVSPSPDQEAASVTAEVAEPTPNSMPTQARETPDVQITGDYRADLAAVDFEPSDEDFEVVMDAHEENICDDPLDLDEMFSRYERGILGNAQNETAGPGMVRVIVEYKCPERSEVVDRILTDAGL